jgi:hypothetical protein
MHLSRQCSQAIATSSSSQRIKARTPRNPVNRIVTGYENSWSAPCTTMGTTRFVESWIPLRNRIDHAIRGVMGTTRFAESWARRDSRSHGCGAAPHAMAMADDSGLLAAIVRSVGLRNWMVTEPWKARLGRSCSRSSVAIRHLCREYVFHIPRRCVPRRGATNLHDPASMRPASRRDEPRRRHRSGATNSSRLDELAPDGSCRFEGAPPSGCRQSGVTSWHRPASRRQHLRIMPLPTQESPKPPNPRAGRIRIPCCHDLSSRRFHVIHAGQSAWF